MLHKLRLAFLARHLLWTSSKIVYHCNYMTNGAVHRFSTIKKDGWKNKSIRNEDQQAVDDYSLDLTQSYGDIFLKAETTKINEILTTSNIPRNKSDKVQRWKQLEALIKKCMNQLEEDCKKEPYFRKAKMGTFIYFIHPFILSYVNKQLKNIENYGYDKDCTYAELRDIRKLVANQFFAQELLRRYPDSHAKHRAFIIKFIIKYHADNQTILEKLFHAIRTFPISIRSLQQLNDRNLIRYWTELLFLMQDMNIKKQIIDQKEFQYIISHIYSYLPEASLSDIKNFIWTFKMAENHQFDMEKVIVTQKLIKIIKTKWENIAEGLQKNQTLQLLYIVSKLFDPYRKRFSQQQKNDAKKITIEIYGKLREEVNHEITNKEESKTLQTKKQQNNFYQDKLLYINHLLGSFRSLHQYDPYLYQFCENFFFDNFANHNFSDVEAFICQRVNLLRFTMKGISMQSSYDDKTKKTKLGNLLKQQRAFTLKFIQTYQAKNVKMSIGELLRLLHLNQSIPIKSRAIKNKLNEILTSSPLTQSNKALAELILQAFAKG